MSTTARAPLGDPFNGGVDLLVEAEAEPWSLERVAGGARRVQRRVGQRRTNGSSTRSLADHQGAGSACGSRGTAAAGTTIKCRPGTSNVSHSVTSSAGNNEAHATLSPESIATGRSS